MGATAEVTQDPREANIEGLVARAKKLGVDVDPKVADADDLFATLAEIEAWPQKVRTVLKRNGIDPATLTTDQRKRAASPPKGLGGARLGEFVLDGTTSSSSSSAPAAKKSGGAKRTGTGAKKSSGRKAASSSSNGDAPAASGPRKGSLMAGALKVLDGQPDGLKVGDIWAEIKRRRLAPDVKGKTPAATLSAQLSVNAKKGRYVKHVGPGTFALLEAK